MTVGEGQGSNLQTKAYYPELGQLTHLRSHGRTPIHETDSVVEVVWPAWHSDAACRDRERAEATGAEWFAVGSAGRSKVPDATFAAIAICEQCPVKEPCRVAGEGEHHGVWGGVDRNDPIRLRDRVNKAARRGAA